MRARGAEPAVLWVFASIACQDDEWETPTAARTHTKGSLYSAPRRAVKAGRNPDDQDGDDVGHVRPVPRLAGAGTPRREGTIRAGDRKSTRLNSSHVAISYAVFCLKKKNTS